MNCTPVKLFIIQSGKKQHEIARETGIPESKLSRIANGHIEIDDESAVALAKALQVTPDEIKGN